MSIIMKFIKKHPVPTYYALTFAISWGGVYLLGVPYGMPTTPDLFNKMWPIVLLPYFLGPTIAGILLTGLVHGRAGYRELRSRLLRWRVGVRWYAVALLTAPLLVASILLALSLVSPVYLPNLFTATDRVGLLLTGLVVGLIFGGLMEELGWTGFATPELLRPSGVAATGLIVGVLHAVWHFLPTYWGAGNSSGEVDLLLLLPPCFFYAGVLTAYRVLMVWVYDHTNSLLVAMLMHASLTASTLFILSPQARGIPLIIYYLVLTAAMWGVVAVIAIANHGRLTRQSLQKQTA